MFDKQFLLLILLLASINSICVYAETGTPSNSAQTIKPLNLTVAPEIIKEQEEQQNTVLKKNEQLLPNIFKDQIEEDVSMGGGILIKNEADSSEVFDGAEIHIKLNTD